MMITNKKILFCVLLFLVSDYASNAQNKTRLGVGDPAPSLSPFRWIRGDSLAGFSRESFYLIEFGATWCKPCIAAIPELSNVQREFGRKVKVVSIFVMERNPKESKYIQNIQTFVKRHSDKIDYSIAADWPDGRMQNEWLAAAELQGIPHLFIVDTKGYIRWVGESTARAQIVIANLLEDKTVWGESDAVSYDPSKLLLIDNNGGAQTDFVFRSLLTRFDGKISGLTLDHVFSFHDFKPDSAYDQFKDRLELIGYPIAKFYYMAYADTLSNIVPVRQNRAYPDTLKLPYTRSTYGKFWHEPILQVSDISPFAFDWNKVGNRYNYSLKVPSGMGTAAFLQSTLRRDLDTYFGYSAALETRPMPYWRLSVLDVKKVQSKLLSKNQRDPLSILDTTSPFVFRNVEMRDLISVLGIHFGYGSLDFGRLPKSEQAPFIDETGITKNIDFIFNPEWTFRECVEYLDSMGLQLTRGQRRMKVVVIKDPPE